jgi:hypothetical protein
MIHAFGLAGDKGNNYVFFLDDVLALTAAK